MTAPTTETMDALAGDFPPASIAQWRALIDKALKNSDFERRFVGRTADGLRIEPLYTARPENSLLAAMKPPTSGMGWDIRQLHAETDPATANAAILEDLAGGASSITLRVGAAGWAGLPCTAASIERSLDGVLLDVCPIALDAGNNTPEAAAGVTALWQARGLGSHQRLGAFNYDPLGTLAQTGGLSVPLPPALQQAATLLHQTLPWPGVSALRANGHVWHAAGASEAQELAGILGAVVAYLRAAEAAGVDPSSALPKIAVNLAVDADQLLGLAKLRAVRRLLSRVAAACGAADARVAVTAETSVAMMTRRDPWVNMLRTTMACATAAWGGADCITVLPFTWALGQPDAFARRMARNTSIVLMEESGLGRVTDPAAGSFAVETLTADLEKAAWALFVEMEAAGGLAAVLSSGKFQEQIARTADEKRKGVAAGKVPLTGTSAFPRLGDDGVVVTPWPIAARAAADLTGVRVTPLTAYRPSEPFEELRDAADAYTPRHGKPPSVFLACLGPLAGHAARATWLGNFLAAGGVASVQSAPLMQSTDAGRAFAESGATVACICAADETYAELGEATAALLKTAGAQRLYLAGRPKDLEASLKAVGVDRFIFAGCDMIEVLMDVHHAFGIDGSNV